MERLLQSYTFTYLARDGSVIGTLDAKCVNDDSAITRGMIVKPRVAVRIEVVCGKRIVAQRNLDNGCA
jgi:hypothetical protein